MIFEQCAQPTILILTGNFGDGHRQAAYAMAEAALRLQPDAEIRVVDVMERSLPHLHRFAQYCYMQWITKFPWLFGYLYDKTKNDTLLSRWFKKVPLCSPGRILDLLEEVKPSVVICTFPAAAAAFSMLKTSGQTTVPMVTVLTDYISHSYWVHPGTDYYIVGSDHVRQALRRWPVPDRKIAVTGIPIRQAFAELRNRTELCRKFGLNPHIPTVMIMGGGYGLIGGNWPKLLMAPELLRKPMQVIIVCGRNEKLQESLTRDLQGYPHRVMITGYVAHVHELMAVSDLLVTKPGGLTISEALASELPMLLYKPLPGQEYENAAYLAEAGAAVQAGSANEFVGQLKQLLEQPQLLANMKLRTRQLARKDSAERAFVNIFGLTHSETQPAAHYPRNVQHVFEA